MTKFTIPVAMAGLMLTIAATAPAWAATSDASLVASCRHHLAAPGAASRADAAQQTALGDCAVMLGDAEAAIAHYQHAVALAPDALALRLQLARVLIAVGRLEQAQRYLIAATRSNPGDPVASRMAELAQMPAFRRVGATANGLRGEVSLSRRYDSNINGASSAASFDALIAGTLVQLGLSDDAKGKPGWASVLSGGASYLHSLGDGNAVVFRGDIIATVYDQHADYNGLEATVGLGLLHSDNALTWSVMPNGRVAWENGQLDRLGAYVDARANLALTDRFSVNGFGKLGVTAAPNDPGSDSWSVVGGVGLHYAFNAAVAGGVTLVLERKGADSAVQSFTKFGPIFYLEATLSEGLTGEISYAYANADFDQTLPIFPAVRADGNHEISAGLTLDLSQWSQGLSASARYSYRLVESTLPLYAHDRHTFTTALRYAF